MKACSCRSNLSRFAPLLVGLAAFLLTIAHPAASPIQGAGEVLAAAPSRPTIVIYKAKRRLHYFENDILKKRFSVVLGKRPRGAKQRRGDLKTPEGAYYVTSKNTRSRFHRFLGLSYPNIRDADRGLVSHILSRNQYDQIKKAIHGGRQPPWGTPMGGYVGIHGEGKYRDFTKRHRINWTDGCISLSDSDVKVLFDLVSIGTPVLIFP